MQVKRYLLAVCTSILSWLICAGNFNPLLLEAMRRDTSFGFIMIAAIAGGTTLGIWSSGSVNGWSRGVEPVTGLRATFVRMTIAVLATLFYGLVLSHFTSGGFPLGALDVIRWHGIFMLGSVWMGIIVTDLLLSLPQDTHTH